MADIQSRNIAAAFGQWERFDLTDQHLRHLVGESAARFGMMPPLASLQLVVEPVDMRLGIEGLSAKIHASLQRSPIEGAAYAFRNQRSNRLKVLLWDRSGVWLAQRRLHHGRFVWPQSGDAVFTLDAAQWQWLVSGVDWQRLAPPALPEYAY